MCFGPVVPNGYGVCYNPMNDHINFAVSAFNSCKETAAAQLAQAVVDVLLDMRTLLEQAPRAKLWGSNRTFPEMKQMLQWDRRLVWFIMHFKWDWISESYCPPHFKWCYAVTKKINKIKKKKLSQNEWSTCLQHENVTVWWFWLDISPSHDHLIRLKTNKCVIGLIRKWKIFESLKKKQKKNLITQIIFWTF